MFSSLNRLSILAAALASLPCAAHAAPPNVVLIISDDQAWTDYGFMGHPHVQTPRLDRLASESLTFTRGYVPSSLCRPSLATIITGLYAHQHRLVGNDPAPTDGAGTDAANLAQRDPALRAEMIAHIDRVPTLPKLLAEQGYVSFQSGKWWEGNYRRGGFTEGMTRGFPAPGGRHGDDGLAIGREGLQPVLDFIRRATRDNKPFFVWYAPMLPHAPHTPPARLVQKYQPLSDSLPIARYWATCEWFDETCGQLLDFLDQHELRQNTLVRVRDRQWLDQSARLCRLRPPIEAIALRRRRAHSDHDSLAGTRAAPTRRNPTGQQHRSGSHDPARLRTAAHAADAGNRSVECDAGATTRSHLRRNL